MAERNLPFSDGYGGGGVATGGGTTGGGSQGSGSRPTDPNWLQIGQEASLADAWAQVERGEITNTQYYQFELNILGIEAYRRKHGQWDVGGGELQEGPLTLRLRREIKGWEELKREFAYGIGGRYVRWMIDNTISDLSRRLSSIRGLAVPKRGERKLPMPNWMEQYLTTSVSALPTHRPEGEQSSRRGGRPTSERPFIAALHPLGAQAELDIGQQEFMQSYLGWAKAGAPTRATEENIAAAADWRKHWDVHTRLSQSLFPKQTKLRKRWTTALQR